MPENELWDEDRAEEMIGKTILVGMTYLDVAGDRLEVMKNPDFTATWQVYPRGSGTA